MRINHSFQITHKSDTVKYFKGNCGRIRYFGGHLVRYWQWPSLRVAAKWSYELAHSMRGRGTFSVKWSG